MNVDRYREIFEAHTKALSLARETFFRTFDAALDARAVASARRKYFLDVEFADGAFDAAMRAADKEVGQ